MPSRSTAAASNTAAPAAMNPSKVTNASMSEDGDAGGTTPQTIIASHRIAAGALPELAHRDIAADKATPQNPPSVSGSSMTNSTKRSPPGISSDSTQNAASKPNFTSRRRQSSIPKIPMGPRPLEYTGSKRSVSNSIAQQFSTIRGASAVASQDPYTHQLSINDISRFSFTSLPSKSLQGDEKDDNLDFSDFLEPTFNFDEFHDNLTATEPSLNNFPLPGGVGPIQVVDKPQAPATQQKKTFTQPAIPIPARKTPANTSLSRKTSTASSNSRLSSKSDPMSTATATTTTSILRGRRQSQFPPNSFNNTGPTTNKAPRKSIGPGTFVAPEISDKAENVKRRPSVGGRKSSTENQKSGLSLRLLNRKSDNSSEPSKSSPRTSKTKSFLGTSKRRESNDLLTPSKTPDRPHSTSNSQQTPNRRSGTPGRTTTPGATAAANRRMSVYATGLGARTVSPTDARRLKRMSTVPPAPPIPHSRISQAPPTPQPEPMPMRPRSTAQSPAAANRKSLTPSSSRTTPDPNRKSYSSGQSLSSNTSYNSFRNSTSINARLSQNLNSSRLPTPKPRLDALNTSNPEGEVPPVPAIPKAYESPGSDFEQPFFSARSSSLPPVDTPISGSPLVTTFADAMRVLETPRAPSSSSRRSTAFQAEMDPRQKPREPSSFSRLSIALQADTEPKQKLQPKPNKRNTMSLRLPPLNLLPLSTPTAAKIKSFSQPKIDIVDPPSTPSALRGSMRTPSTPMTASKATFFSRSQRVTEETNVIRSSTSHHVLRPNTLRPPSDSSPSLPVFSFEADIMNDRNISPFISSSLPKSSGEFANYMRPNFTTELSRTSQTRPSGPRAPSFSLPPKAIIAQSPVEKVSESESTFSGSGLRRKLSRKKSDSKMSESPQQNEDLSKYDNMPPPKLPASATWSNPLTGSASPVQKPSYLKSRRQASGSSTNTAPERQQSFDSAVTHVSASGQRPSMESSRSFMMHSNRSGSLSTTANLLNAKPPQPKPQLQEPPLDRDDMIAEEEMKKLASKRKDFESAARELDGLRARARPVHRMSATTASQLHPLNIFERGEIVDFADIYFTGTKNARKIIGDLNSTASNFGYDDERGDYNIVNGDHLAYRYEVVDLLGKGSFGQVVRCVDHKTGILVAVKIIRNKKRFHQQALVEVNILRKLKEWDPMKKHSVVNFDQEFYFRGHLCISTDLLGMNLYEFIKAHDFRGFSLKLIRRFTKQLLNSLILLHKHKVIHCDLKPENILLAHPVHSEIKVIDFGSSCFENEKVYTYIQSRFYRSPEVILGMSYGMPIDMWSVGCILAELFTGYPIFPGENEQEQLACIMEVFGPPEKHLIEKSSRKKLFFDSMGKPRLTVSSKGRRRRPSSKELRQVLKCDDEGFLDFIARCLRWDPARRLSPHDAMKHEFITGVKSTPTTTRKTFGATVSSPVKRVNSVTATNGTRPLPQPPTTSFKVGTASRQDTLTSSPIKSTARRQSTALNGFQATSQAKRASHAAMTSSASNPNLARVAIGQRSMSGRSDLATAAATASLVK